MPVEILFVAGFSPIVADASDALEFYEGALGVDFEHDADGYRYTEALKGVRHMGLWPLSAAAESCFGTTSWPSQVPVPQASLELEVPDVPAAAKELEEKGLTLIHAARTEPWGQEVARLLSPDGLLIGLSSMPGHEGDA
jgi:catechol 2,3-dioxygenase-like lactoylglutathione lyase family enzyme